MKNLHILAENIPGSVSITMIQSSSVNQAGKRVMKGVPKPRITIMKTLTCGFMRFAFSSTLPISEQKLLSETLEVNVKFDSSGCVLSFPTEPRVSEL